MEIKIQEISFKTGGMINYQEFSDDGFSLEISFRVEIIGLVDKEHSVHSRLNEFPEFFRAIVFQGLGRGLDEGSLRSDSGVFQNLGDQTSNCRLTSALK